MKKAVIVLAVILVLILIGGVGYIVWDNAQSNIGQAENNKPNETIVNDTAKAAELREKLKGNFPKMDGSTSTIPLEAGIVAAFEGISQEEAEAKIKHSTTYGSFENLLEGKCELVFVPLLSDEQKKAAADKGIELEIVPITKEAFVFVINPDNTVDTLTQEQIRKIYTGEIKNWKELGGDDAEIVAYQRDETSGSQNNMKVFMKGYNLIKAKQEFILESMNSILDVIAGYDNGKYSIGYSVHAYARNMYNYRFFIFSIHSAHAHFFCDYLYLYFVLCIAFCAYFAEALWLYGSNDCVSFGDFVFDLRNLYHYSL